MLFLKLIIMKTTVQNTRQITKRIFLPLLIVFFALTASAQTLQELGAMLATMNASSDPAIRQQAAHLDSLVFQVQPKIQITNFVLGVTGQAPAVCLESDAQSVGMLINANPLFQEVELITIQLNGPGDLNFILDLANLPGFEHLKYIQFLCSFNSDPQLIQSLFLSNNTGITVFYNISIPN
jgi:hypothetical protein